MMEIKAGMPVRSKAGHDKGHWYLVLSEEGTYAYLIDGQKRTAQRPKKKHAAKRKRNFSGFRKKNLPQIPFLENTRMPLNCR